MATAGKDWQVYSSMASEAPSFGIDTHQVLKPGRRAGVSLHITSLPGRYGIGEIGRKAREFVDVLRQMELSVWQFLPLGPTAYGDSPYQPLSSFAGNEMLIDTDALIDAGYLAAEDAAFTPSQTLKELAASDGKFTEIDTGGLRTARN